MVSTIQRAEQLVQTGIAAAREGRHGEAQQSLREAVRLAPDLEQAWLWLSGVEDSDQRKIAALNEVLRINPANAAAWRGLEHLNQPKVVDLAEFLPGAAPLIPPPAPATPPPALAAPTQMPAKKIETGNLAAGADSSPVSDLFANLRPALAKANANGKRPFWLRPSEIVILAIVGVVLFGGLRYARGRLNTFIPDSPRADATDLPGAATAPSQAGGAVVTVEPVATRPPANPVKPAEMIRSQSYGVQVMSVDVDADNQGLTVNFQLTNLTNRQARYRDTDFTFRNGNNQPLTIDPAISSLVSGKPGAIFVIDTGKPKVGAIRLTGDVSALPIVMVWQPTNGGKRQEIVVR